jgi:hypothetical protein
MGDAGRFQRLVLGQGGCRVLARRDRQAACPYTTILGCVKWLDFND